MLGTESRFSRQPRLLTHTRLFSSYTAFGQTFRSWHLQILLARMAFPLLLRAVSHVTHRIQLSDTLPMTPSPAHPPSRQGKSVSSLTLSSSRHRAVCSHVPLPTGQGAPQRQDWGCLSSESQGPPAQPAMVGAWQMLSGRQELSERQILDKALGEQASFV